MKLLGLLAVITVAYASHIYLPESEWLNSLVPERQLDAFEFREGKEYKFFYNGQLATGIPGSSHQHSATRIQALVSIVFRSRHELLLKLVNTRFGKLNDELYKPRDIMPFRMFEQVEIEPELMQRLSKPVKCVYREGIISDIVFDGQEQPWSANIKRGVLNMLQVNLNKERQIRETPEHLRTPVMSELPIVGGRNVESYKTMEKTVEGECETLYTIVSNKCRETSEYRCRSVDAHVLNITKSIDFESCVRRPEIRYNERFQQVCPTCESRYNTHERSLRSSTVQKINMVCTSESRESCIVEQSSVESLYNVVLFNEDSNMITAYVNQTLELIRESEIETEISAPHSPIKSDSDMVYTPDWDIYKEQFFLEGEDEFHTKTPFSRVQNKIEFVKTVLRKLVHYMREQVDEEAPRQYARLVKVLRMLKLGELHECYERFYKNTPEGFTREEHQKIKDLLVDAVAMCGTHDCVEALVFTIKKDRITPVRASFALKKLMDVRVVSPRMIEKVMSICEETEKCRRHPILRQSVYLTCGSMMRSLCSETRDKLAVEFKQPGKFMCTTAVKEQFIQKIVSKLIEKEQSIYDQILGLKTLGNAGLDLSIKVLEKIILNVDRHYPTDVRVEAILACRQLVDQIPAKINKILLPIFVNRDESAEVRMAAVYQIIYTVPDKLVIDQITRTLKTERHRQVSAMTFTLLQSFANTTEPCQKRLADDIKLSLRHARYLPTNAWYFNSKYIRLFENYHHSIKMGYSVDMASIMSNMSFIPKTWAMSLNLNAAGQWSPRFLTFNFRQTGLSRLLNKILRSQSHNLQSSLDDLISGKFKLSSGKYNYRKELKDMFEKLDIEDLSYDEFEPFAQLGLKVRNMDYGFVPLSKDIIPEELLEMISSENSLNTIVKRAERMLRDVSMPFSFHAGTFLTETSRKIPTSIGLPLRLSIKAPTVVQATGVFKVEIDEQNPLKKVKIVVKNVKPSIVTTFVSKLECWSPILNTGVKVIAQAKIFTPFEGSVQLDMARSPADLRVSFKPLLSGQEEIFAIRTRPICFTLVWPKFLEQWMEPEEKTIYGSEWNRVYKHNVEFGEHALGVKFHSRGFWHRIPEKCVPGTPNLLMAGPNKYTLTMQPGYEMPREYVLKVTGKLFKFFEKKIVSPDFDNFYKSTEQYLKEDSSEEVDFDNKYYKSYKGEEPVNNEIEVRLYTEGSSLKREAELKTKCFCDSEMKSCKCELVCERTPIPMLENKPWKFVSKIEFLYPQTPFLVSEVTSDKRFMCKISTKWGEKSSMEKFVEIKMIAEQSARMQHLKERSLYTRMYQNPQHREQYRSLFSPVAQYKHTMRHSFLDEYKIDIDYKLDTFEKQIMSIIYRMIKSQYYSQSEVRDINIRNPENQIRMKLNVDPINRRYLNVTFMTPREVCTILDIPSSYPIVPRYTMNMRRLSTPSRSWYHLFTQWTSPMRPTCEIRTDRIRTFDQVSYDIPTSTCYSVLAKDCSRSEDSKFAVLLKKQSPTTEKKTIKIVTPSTKLIIRAVESEKLECELNGKVKRCSQIEEVLMHKQHTVLRCWYNERAYMQCELPEAGVKVYFDGYSANIKVSPIYASEVCGLCGQYDQNIYNEMSSPRRSILSSPREMLESYLVNEQSETCEHEFTPERTLMDFDFENEYERFDELEQIESPVRTMKNSRRPIKVTKMVEQPGEICFSKRPVPKCPRNTYPIEHVELEKVVYGCLPRNNVQAEIYQRELIESRNVELSAVRELPASFTESLRVPKLCREY